MEIKTVLISGKMGSGKTTIGNALMEKYHKSKGFSCENPFFASTIYEMHDQCLRVLKERGIRRDIKKDGRLLQLLGTEWGRETIDDNVWVDCLRGQILNLTRLHTKGLKNTFLILPLPDNRGYH